MKSNLIFIAAFASLFAMGVLRQPTPPVKHHETRHIEKQQTFAEVRKSVEEQAKNENKQSETPTKKAGLEIVTRPKPQTTISGNQLICHSQNKNIIPSKYDDPNSMIYIADDGKNVLITNSDYKNPKNSSVKLRLPITNFRELNEEEIKKLFKPYSNCTATINIDNFRTDECGRHIIKQYKSNGTFSYGYCGRGYFEISGKYHIEDNIVYTKEDRTNIYSKFKILIDNNQIYYLKQLGSDVSTTPKPIIISE